MDAQQESDAEQVEQAVETTDVTTEAGAIDPNAAPASSDFMPKSAQVTLVDKFWAIDDGYAQNALAILDKIDIKTAKELNAEFMAAIDKEEKASAKPYAQIGDIAVLSIDGPMTKKMTSAAYLFGGTSTSQTRDRLKAAMDDPSVSKVLIRIESPGGQVGGTAELADDIREMGAKKPIFAFVEDLMASAALWVGSQATAVYANKGAKIGSIGVFATIADSSEMANRVGVKFHLITTGKYKGGGQPGTRVTDAHLENWQHQIDGTFADFKDAIATGRKMDSEAVDKIADGRMLNSDEALAAGLIDGVCSFEQCFSLLASTKANSRRPAPTGATTPATVQQAHSSAKEKPMNIKDIMAKLRGLPAEDLEKAGLKAEDLVTPDDAPPANAVSASEFASLKATVDALKAGQLNQAAENAWKAMITPTADGRALATWSEREGFIATFKALATMDGEPSFDASGAIVPSAQLTSFLAMQKARTPNYLQAEQIANAKPGLAGIGLNTGLLADAVRRARSAGKIKGDTATKMIDKLGEGNS